MFIASAIYAPAVLILNALVAPSLIGKARKPTTAGEASLGLLLNGLLAGAVYVLWRYALAISGVSYVNVTVVAGILWALTLAGILITIAKIGKPRNIMTTRAGIICTVP
jgi:hypothetical protein